MPELDHEAGGAGGVRGRVAFRRLLPGDRFPSLSQACGDKPRFAFDTAAGRYQLFALFLSLDHRNARQDLDAIMARRDLFDDEHCCFFGVSIAPRDRNQHGLKNVVPGYRFVWDFDHKVSQALGATPLDSRPGEAMRIHRQWVLVDPSLHILDVFSMDDTPVEAVIERIANLPPPGRFGGVRRPPPVMLLPNIFEPDLCRALMDAYEAQGGQESGIHREGAGVLDFSFKRRKDCTIDEPELLRRTNTAIARRIVPEIERVFFMTARYVERHIVGCYSAQDGGHFSPHIDNGQGLTAHRRFAVSINLNDDFEGGGVFFPEYSEEPHKAPAGWALIFPCGILHAVRPVTKGARYAFLPFVYDEAGRAIREAELAKLAETGAAAG